VMSIMSTNPKNTNVWGIPSMETYLTSIMIRKKKKWNEIHREDRKRINLTAIIKIYSINWTEN
jgi:hypothetical protein